MTNRAASMPDTDTYGDRDMRPDTVYVFRDVGFADQHAREGRNASEARKSQAAVALNRKECPIEWYFHRGIVTLDQHAAAMKLRAHWELFQLGKQTALDPSRVRVDGGQPLGMTDRQLDGVRAVNGSLRAMGLIGSSVVVNVCCVGITLGAVEAAMRWRKGYGAERLREALDDLAVHYGFRTRRREIPIYRG